MSLSFFHNELSSFLDKLLPHVVKRRLMFDTFDNEFFNSAIAQVSEAFDERGQLLSH